MNIGTKLGEGLQVLILGLGITLIALGLLILVVNLINKLVNGGKESTTREVTDKSDETVLNENIDDNIQTSDNELVAVISAAIAVMLDDGEQPFKIKSIRQIPASTPKWNQAGRREQLLNRR